jgi:hypothetical protein
MSYTVRYLPEAEQELAALWMNSSKRAAVTQAAHRIDRQLQQAPNSSANLGRKTAASILTRLWLSSFA